MKKTIFKNTIKSILVGFLLVGNWSCTDFLEEQAPSNLTPESFYTIPDHAEAAIASVYADLRFVVAVRDAAHLDIALRNLNRATVVLRAARSKVPMPG